MHRLTMILPLALLAGCLSPQESCISQVSRNLRVLDTLIAETQGNLARGYALAEEQEVVTVRATCTGIDSTGGTFEYTCPQTETVSHTVPVAIDLDAERAKLGSQQRRRAEQASATQAAIRNCRAQYPE